jgi:hypothetical protein
VCVCVCVCVCIIAEYIFVWIKLFWETLIDVENDPRLLDQVNKIVLECETGLVDNLRFPVIGETLSKFCHKFWWNFKYTFVFLKKHCL